MKILSKSYYTYIVQCSDGTYYVGKTSNLSHRVSQHNGEKSGGAHYTKIRRPVVLRYYETYLTNQEACQREARLKKLSRNQKKALIQLSVT